MKLIFPLFLVLPFLGFSQISKKDSLWLPFENFIGDWKGTGEGVDGNGTYERSYRLVLNKNFIELRNKTIYPPSDRSPKGYVHEDVGYISYDRMRKKFVLRQLHGEGFINQYILESLSSDSTTFVFVSETIENIPQGWRARETITINEKELTEVFDLAQPGKEFEPYTKAKLLKQ